MRENWKINKNFSLNKWGRLFETTYFSLQQILRANTTIVHLEVYGFRFTELCLPKEKPNLEQIASGSDHETGVSCSATNTGLRSQRPWV